MQINSQVEPLNELNRLAQSHRQSVMIVGPAGCGKSYLSQQYANMLKVDDYAVIQPKTGDIREALDSCITINNPVMLEISNLDTGVPAASYTLLKSLEEPLHNLYIVVTCRNIQGVPDTIVSRSAVINVGPPTLADLDNYGKERDLLKFNNINSRLVWKCVRSFSDADAALAMAPDEIAYYESLSESCRFKESVSNIVWKISHYQSGSECNVELAIRSIMELMHKPFITQCGIECIRDLNQGRIAQYAVLSKFVFNAKFCE